MPLSREDIDARAAAREASEAEATAAAATALVANPEPTLVFGAKGDDVTKLVNLLGLLGYETSVHAEGGPAVLDETVLSDVRAAQTALGVTEPELTEPSGIPVGVQGEVVGQVTWNALYAAAEAKVEPAAIAPAVGEAQHVTGAETSA